MNVKLINGNTYNINKWTVNRLFKEIYQIYKDWGLTGADYGSACQEVYSGYKYWLKEKDYETIIDSLVYTKERMLKIGKDVDRDMKKLLKEVQDTLDQIDKGYEMGCLISSEFTPSPDLSPVIKVLGNKEKDLMVYMEANEHPEYIDYIKMELAYAKDQYKEPDQQGGYGYNL